MKSVKALSALSSILFVSTVFAGSIQVPGISGQIQVTSFKWEGANPAAKCLGGRQASFLTTGPAAAEEQLMQMCTTHQQIPQLAVDLGTEHHVLQQVAFLNCKTNGLDNPPTRHFTVEYHSCAMHVAPIPAQVISEVRGTENVKLLSLHFQGKTGTIVLQPAFGDPGSLFTHLYQSKQTLPHVGIKANNQMWTFNDMLVSGYQQGAEGRQTFNFSFNGMSGPPGGYGRP